MSMKNWANSPAPLWFKILCPLLALVILWAMLPLWRWAMHFLMR
jgi:hypothetical protein